MERTSPHSATRNALIVDTVTQDEIEDFTDDDAFGPPTQTIAYQVAHGDLALALEIGRSRFQAHHVRLLQLQFGRVLAGHDVLVVVDIAGQTIEQRRLAGAGVAIDITMFLIAMISLTMSRISSRAESAS